MTEHIPWDELQIAKLIGEKLLRDANSPLWRHEGFVLWLADEQRAAEERPATTRQSDAAFLTRGRELRARVLARALGIHRATRMPVARQITYPVGLSQMLEQARAEGMTPVVDLGVAAGVGRELWDETPEQWVELPSEVPKDRRYIALRIVGESMAPVMHTGDVVLVHAGVDVKTDTVIVARHPEDGYVCKRVSKVRKRSIELASLEPGRSPITIPRDPALVVGTVLLVWSTHRDSGNRGTT
jgi:SOS-response transcriptional repressor LexA